MITLLGTVTSNSDPDQLRRVQCSIEGLTEGVNKDDLPWAFPRFDQVRVPSVDDKVIVEVEKFNNEEDYDYSRLYYKPFTDVIYKEAYDLSNSDSYKAKSGKEISGTNVTEPTVVSSAEYPKNRVFKYSKFTVEFDEGNQRFTITDDTSGAYLQFKEGELILKGMGDTYVLADGNINLKSNTGNIYIEDSNNRTIIADQNGLTLQNGDGGPSINLGTYSVTINGASTFEVLL